MLLTLKNVTYTYSPATPFSHVALKNVSLEVNRGDFIGVIGHTGCGKSTLIQVMAGLLQPERGEVLLDGEDIFNKNFNRKKLRRTLGVVFQYPEYQLFEETVGLDVAYGPKKAGYDEKKTDECVSWALSQVGLDRDEVGGLSPFELSGGQKRKAAIAGVLALRPEILILDEPIAGLDPKGREEFMAFVSSLHAQGITIIMISHNMDGLCENASRIIVMNRSEIVRDDTPGNVFSDTEFLRGLGLGTSEAREIVGMLRDRGIDVPESIITYAALMEHLKERIRG